MIDLGSVYQVAVDVRDASGVLTNPATATLTITLPDGTTVTPTVTLPPTEAGKLRVDYVPPQAGRHTWRLVTTGPVTAYTDTFDVRESAPVALMSLADAKKQLNIPAATTTDDDELRGFMAATTGAVEKARGEIVARRSVTERHTVPGLTDRLILGHAPVISLTSVQTTDGATTWTVADLDVDGPSGLITVKAGPLLSGELLTTHVAGYQIVPEHYRLASLIILQHLWETQRGTMGVTLGGEGDSFVPGFGFAIPNRAAELLGLTMPGVA